MEAVTSTRRLRRSLSKGISRPREVLRNRRLRVRWAKLSAFSQKCDYRVQTRVEEGLLPETQPTARALKNGVPITRMTTPEGFVVNISSRMRFGIFTLHFSSQRRDCRYPVQLMTSCDADTDDNYAVAESLNSRGLSIWLSQRSMLFCGW